MTKKYELPEENPENKTVNEPAMEYGYQAETEMIYSPPLTEEELANAISSDDFWNEILEHVDKLYNKK